MACNSQIKVSFNSEKNNYINASLKISQNEIIGNCIFHSYKVNANDINFSYVLSFSQSIMTSGLNSALISNLGTGGNINLDWGIEDCGDGRHLKIFPIAIQGDGSVGPEVSNLISTMSTSKHKIRLDSNLTSILVNYDTASPAIEVSRSVSESIGTCSFTETSSI